MLSLIHIFSGTDQSKLCSVLSGGERNRLQLALALKPEGNVLLLDEPTNDIDVNTLRALAEGLEAFAGCAGVISHDRDVYKGQVVLVSSWSTSASACSVMPASSLSTREPPSFRRCV